MGTFFICCYFEMNIMLGALVSIYSTPPFKVKYGLNHHKVLMFQQISAKHSSVCWINVSQKRKLHKLLNRNNVKVSYS